MNRTAASQVWGPHPPHSGGRSMGMDEMPRSLFRVRYRAPHPRGTGSALVVEDAEGSYYLFSGGVQQLRTPAACGRHPLARSRARGRIDPTVVSEMDRAVAGCSPHPGTPSGTGRTSPRAANPSSVAGGLPPTV